MQTIPRAIIVEDDYKHQQTLKEELKNTRRRVDVVATCTNVDDAYKTVIELKPDILFLDIELKNSGTGFDLLKKFDVVSFAVIFTTAQNNKDTLLAALRACAIDFVGKPFSTVEINAALDLYDEYSMRQAQTLVENQKKMNTIWLKLRNKKVALDVNNIIYCQSQDNITYFYLQSPVDKHSYYTSGYGLGYWEDSLQQTDIVRTHNQYLVHIRQVADFKSHLSGTAELILKSGMKIPVSKNRKQAVKARLRL